MICFATIETVVQINYGFSPGESGLAYFGLPVRFVLCQLSMGHFSDWYIKKMQDKHGDKKPEYPLPPIFIGVCILPVVFLWYGWSMQEHTHWIVPIIGSTFIAIGILYTYLPIQLYMVDAYTVFAASASAVCTIKGQSARPYFHFAPTTLRALTVWLGKQRSGLHYIWFHAICSLTDQIWRAHKDAHQRFQPSPQD